MLSQVEFFDKYFVFIYHFHHACYVPFHFIRFDLIIVIIQSDQKVTQPILKHLLIVAIKYNSTGLINTKYRCDYTRAHAGHIML
jgi:hypothetical protein